MENSKHSVASVSTFQWTLLRFMVDPLVPCAALNGDPHLWIQVDISETIGDFIQTLKEALGIQIEIELYYQGYNLPVLNPGTWFTTLPELIVTLPAGSSNYAMEHYGIGKSSAIHLPINPNPSPPPPLNAMAFETPVDEEAEYTLPVAFDNEENKTNAPIAEAKNTSDEGIFKTKNSSERLMILERCLGESVDLNSVNTAPVEIIPDTGNTEKTSVLRNVASSSPSLEATKSSGQSSKGKPTQSRLKACTRINSPLRDGNSEGGSTARRSQQFLRLSLPKISSPAGILNSKKRKYSIQDQDENTSSNNEQQKKFKMSQYNESDVSQAGSDFGDEIPQKADKRKIKAKGNRRRSKKRQRLPATTTENFVSPKEFITKPCSVIIERLEISFDLDVKKDSIVSPTEALKTSSKHKIIFNDGFVQTSHETKNSSVVERFDKIASKKPETGYELSSVKVTQSTLPSIPAELRNVVDIHNKPPQSPHSVDSVSEFRQHSLDLLPATSEPAQDYGEYENHDWGYSMPDLFDFSDLIIFNT